MAIRNIIQIDEARCDGCGQCVTNCAEGALALIDGKAKIIADSYCDGLGACIGACPQDALTVIRRESAPFDEELVAQRMQGGCPGTDSRAGRAQWPLKLMLVPGNTPFLKNAHLLLAADCAAAASPLFHSRFAKGHVLLIACPKLGDSSAQSARLREIFSQAEPASLTVLRMEVPCCRALTFSARKAAEEAGSGTEIREAVLTTSGTIGL